MLLLANLYALLYFCKESCNEASCNVSLNRLLKMMI